jgi:hypothetical protein
MKEKRVRLAGSAIIVVLLIIAGIAFFSNSRNKRNLKQEKLQNESIMSQRNKATQDLDNVKSDLTALKSKDEITNKALASEKTILKEKERRIAYISKENSSLMKDKNELAQLKKSKAALDKSYQDLELQHVTALSLIKDLENSKIALDSERKELMSELESSQKDRIDNVELYASRGNRKNKITFIARRARELNLSFDTPLSKADAISYKIISPSGKIINPEDKLSAWTIVDNSPQKMTASLSSASADPENARKIELKDNSKDKLIPGVYTIQIFGDNIDIGNYKLKLR